METSQSQTDLTEISTEFTVLVNSILDGYVQNSSDVNLILENENTVPTNVTQSVNKNDIDCGLSNTLCINVPQFSDIEDTFFNITREKEIPKTIEDVLKILRKSVDNETSNTFNVFREEIFTCCVRAMRRQTFSPYKKLIVKFSDMEVSSEGAVP